MVAFADDRTGWVVARSRHLVARVGQLELLDRAYTLAAQSFVALFPLILAIAAALASPGSNIVAEEFIKRFGLAGAAAQAVQDLIVVRTEGIYWLGLVLTVYAAFTLSKRASRAYNAVWGTPQLPVRAQWRALVWIVVQLLLIVMVAGLRTVVRSSGVVLALLTAALIVGVCVPRRGIHPVPAHSRSRRPSADPAGSGYATVGRFGIVVWSALFLTQSIVRQAESYGPSEWCSRCSPGCWPTGPCCSARPCSPQ